MFDALTAVDVEYAGELFLDLLHDVFEEEMEECW